MRTSGRRRRRRRAASSCARRGVGGCPSAEVENLGAGGGRGGGSTGRRRGGGGALLWPVRRALGGGGRVSCCSVGRRRRRRRCRCRRRRRRRGSRRRVVGGRGRDGGRRGHRFGGSGRHRAAGPRESTWSSGGVARKRGVSVGGCRRGEAAPTTTPDCIPASVNCNSLHDPRTSSATNGGISPHAVKAFVWGSFPLVQTPHACRRTRRVLRRVSLSPPPPLPPLLFPSARGRWRTHRRGGCAGLYRPRHQPPAVWQRGAGGPSARGGRHPGRRLCPQRGHGGGGCHGVPRRAYPVPSAGRRLAVGCRLSRLPQRQLLVCTGTGADGGQQWRWRGGGGRGRSAAGSGEGGGARGRGGRGGSARRWNAPLQD